MSYASLIKSLPETLSQPTGIAALVSLGIHGALGLILPVLPFDSTPEEPQQKTVGVVQLTPTEQSRLPQSFQPQVTLPFFATQQSLLPTLPPAPYLPPNTSATMLFPSFKTPVNKYPPIYSLPKTQAYRVSPLTQSQSRQPTSQSFSFAKKPISAPRQTVKTYDIAKLSDIMSGLAAAPVVPEELQSYRVSPTPENFNQPIPTPTDNQPNPTPTDNQPNPTPADNQQAAVNNSEANQSFTPNQQHQGFEKMKQEILNRRREQPAANSDGSVSSAAAQRGADLQAWNDRQSRVREEYRDVDTKPPIYEKLSTSQKDLSGGVAVLGVVVNTEGKIVSGPEFIGQPSVPGIEQAARDYVTKYQFPATRKITNYQFRLEFKYEADNANATPESAPDSAEAPKPAPVSAATPESAPDSTEAPKPSPTSEVNPKP